MFLSLCSCGHVLTVVGLEAPEDFTQVVWRPGPGQFTDEGAYQHFLQYLSPMAGAAYIRVLNRFLTVPLVSGGSANLRVNMFS